MAITLDLKPEVEAELMAQAEAAALSLAQFLSRELEAIAPAAPAKLPATLPDTTDQWEKELDEWLDSFPSIRFCMRKHSSARTGIPTGGNAGEEGNEDFAQAELPALPYASEREGILECMHSSDRA